MNSWHRYPSIFNMGHRAIEKLLDSSVYVEEKIDGSQFSFGLDPETGLRARSKGAQLHIDAPEKMFNKAVATVKNLEPLLHPGWTYRAEYLAKPKHNALAYERIPEQHLIIFDINNGDESYLTYAEKKAEAERIGLEIVPLLHEGMIENLQQFRDLLETVSILGGQNIEGVVVKPVGYELWGQDKKCLLGKFVSESFRETHAKSWKTSNPGQNDILTKLGETYNCQGRWMKAVQHLREQGKIQDSVKDIGLILREIPEDIQKECEEEIKETLFAWAWPHIRRKVGKGFADWYKEELLKKQFEVTS